ncbi:MAG: hypothetical protein JRI25_15185 [Deltaproteobacteria bacterium]|nr:hypothetical protein [Deltaproteobacteria bacterium]MBW2255925.1 hypothetical protein [Deltaproteobacteria bacterium]
MIELERKGKEGMKGPVERQPTGHLAPVLLQGPRQSRATGWSPTEWRSVSKKKATKS